MSPYKVDISDQVIQIHSTEISTGWSSLTDSTSAVELSIIYIPRHTIANRLETEIPIHDYLSEFSYVAKIAIKSFLMFG